MEQKTKKKTNGIWYCSDRGSALFRHCLLYTSLIVNAETQSGMSRAYGIWLAGNNSTLDIHGDTEITANGNDWSYGVLAGQEAKINLEGVKIRVNNAAKESGALKGSAKSIISVLSLIHILYTIFNFL